MDINTAHPVIVVDREPRKRQLLNWIIAPNVSYQLLKKGIVCSWSEWVTSKQAKLRALSLLACNFGHLELAGLAWLIEIVRLACLLDRLIDFV